ncbi:MAG TPA: Hsp20/alpha crystallin family protein [Gemmatimonadales bacterium]|nr:Hsp20/alpha crystallin family protein [Gemmatimonadales bacterium]
MVGVTGYRDPAGLFGLQRLNRFLDEAFAGVPTAEQGSVITSAWFAPTDVSEDANGIQISMEVPGVDPDEVRLSLENNILTISGEKKHQVEQSNERVHRFERTYGTFERAFVLPNTVDPEKIDARYENGVLFVTVPKAERAKPREIRVKSSAGSSKVGAGTQTQRVSGKSTEGGQEAVATSQRSNAQGSPVGAR